MNNQSQKRAILQLKELEKLADDKRLAADDWKEDWQTLIATLMSARTTDKKTIPVAQELFDKYDLKALAKTSPGKIAKIIRPVNFYRTKSKNISNLAKILINSYNGEVPHDFLKLIELPGVGRKTANVFLAEKGHARIGCDTHVIWCSNQLGWTKSDKQQEVEKDLEELFPKEYWGKINWVLVRFGQTYISRNKKKEILDKIKKIK